MGDGTVGVGRWKNVKGHPRRNWHSRRHETADAHRTAKSAYQQEHGRPARIRKAIERGNTCPECNHGGCRNERVAGQVGT